MELKPGTRLGQYEILALIGKGGMGEVYHGFDTKLKRDVALKVLPSEFARDPDRLGRFRREATLLASLNHPNIAQIYGVEDSGETHALVMEYVPGETLADLIRDSGIGTRGSGGGVAVEEAVRIASQIAEALDHAHEKNTIHRDLKPANVKLTPEGQVKVLDFGLAKAFAGDGSGASDQFDSQSPTVLTASPTLPGVILGTAAYMSPEQARGKPVDKRTDIWAFGCVLYELLTGKQTFRDSGLGARDSGNADTVQDIIAAILKGEPDWSALPATTPWRVRDLLRRCLQKDKTQRLRDAGDARLDLSEALTPPITERASRVSQIAGWRRAAILGLAGLAIAVIAIFAAWNLKPTSSAALQSVARLTMVLPAEDRLDGLDLSSMEFSPDGKQLAYVARRGGAQKIFLRSLDSAEDKPVAGSEGATSPFFSPDGQWLGFFTEDKLKQVSLSGGAPVVLSPARNFGRGGSWGDDGSIIFASLTTSGLLRVPATGGTPESLTSLDAKKGEGSHRFPHHLPGGRSILFTVGTGGSWDDARIEVLRLDTGERKALINGGSDARYVPTGHLVYIRSGSLMAVPFDLDRLEVTGTPTAVINGVMQSTNNTGAAQIALSNLGWLVYVPGSGSVAERRLTWVDRRGIEQVLPAPARPYRLPRLSPDGQRLAVDIDEGNKTDSWVYDISRETLTRLTFEGYSLGPIWTPDGKKITYGNQEGAARYLSWKAADGSGVVERLTSGEYTQDTGSWSPDGQTLAFHQTHPITGEDIWTLSLKDNRKQQPFLQTPFNEVSPAFSPNGRWLAYDSNESGSYEVYVRPFPGPGEKWQVSAEGGRQPAWSRDGRELFYRNDDKMMAASVVTEPAFRTGKPEMLFEKHFWTMPLRTNYDVAPDGRRFVMIKESEQVSNATQINVVLNWFEELKRRVPAAR